MNRWDKALTKAYRETLTNLDRLTMRIYANSAWERQQTLSSWNKGARNWVNAQTRF